MILVARNDPTIMQIRIKTDIFLAQPSGENKINLIERKHKLPTKLAKSIRKSQKKLPKWKIIYKIEPKCMVFAFSISAIYSTHPRSLILQSHILHPSSDNYIVYEQPSNPLFICPTIENKPVNFFKLLPNLLENKS